MLRAVDDILAELPKSDITPLPAPGYHRDDDGVSRVFAAWKDFERHTADAGAQLQWGLEHAGYLLVGAGYPDSVTDFAQIAYWTEPSALIIQDPREWMGRTARQRRDPTKEFTNIEAAAERGDFFRVGVSKDHHQQAEWHGEFWRKARPHAWLTYYDTRVACHLAGFLRPDHCIRTYHTVKAEDVPGYSPHRPVGCLLSGATSTAYPLRSRLMMKCDALPETDFWQHPGYGTSGCKTPEYLKLLSQYKVAICTSSRYGYALRKITEATACGCMVVTDLPVDDPLPFIDGNLYRVSPDIRIDDLTDLLRDLLASYDDERQEHYAREAVRFYDYRVQGLRLAWEIERFRNAYP